MKLARNPIRLMLAGLAFALMVASCGGTAPRGEPRRGSSQEFRTVLLDGRPVLCAAVFRTDAQHRQGLSGSDAPGAGAFLNDPASQPSLWMRNVPRDLVAVWVGTNGVVLGSVRMKAETTTLHRAPAPVPLILELNPSVWQHRARSTKASLGGSCRS
jgi:uncharacterized membrane protein (UPF0127 family)